MLKATAGLTLGSCVPELSSVRAAASPPESAGTPSSSKDITALIQIGIFLSTFRGNLEARLDAVRANGLDSVQLSMDCAGLAAMPDEIAPELIARIRRGADERQIQIGSVQGTFNMCHPDPEHRRTGVRRIGVLAAICQPLGCSRIHLCSGTRDRSNMWRRNPQNDSPEAWQDMVACVREAVEIARPSGVTLAFEPEVNNIVDSATKARRLMDEIGSPKVKVTMDASNLFHTGEFAHMSEVLDQAFALVGKDVVMAHAKDVSRDGDAGHEPAGQGKLDYLRYLTLLHANGFKGPLFLHGLSEAQVPGCVAFLRERMSRVTAA
jgi:sugar phosphate isomerase/epimerase